MRIASSLENPESLVHFLFQEIGNFLISIFCVFLHSADNCFSLPIQTAECSVSAGSSTKLSCDRVDV